MKNILIVETSEKNNTTTKAYLRLSYILQNILNAEFSFSNEKLKNENKKYEIIIVVYSSYYFKWKYWNYIFEKNKNAKFFWVTNEYDNNLNSSLYNFIKNNKEIDFNIVINLVEKGFKCNYKYNDYYQVNLNVLLLEKKRELIKKKYDCIYYGTLRKKRVEYFKEYFDNNIYLSTSKKNMKYFKDFGINPKFVDKLSWEKGRETLNLFRYSLYIEDRFTHSNYNYLANRFYEALYCNCILFFDINCKNTVDKSGYKISDYFFVKDRKDLLNKIKNDNFKKSLNIQNEWYLKALKEKKEIIKQVREIFNK